MLNHVPYQQYAAAAIDTLSKGAFLVTRQGEKVNAMTIAWGSIGFLWGKPVFQVMVRPSRYSYELLEASQEFTVSIPLGEAQAALALCGSKSGRDMDKIAAAGLSLQPAQQIATPIISECQLHYECRVVCRQPLTAPELQPALEEKWYGGANHHMIYWGEILASYRTDA